MFRRLFSRNTQEQDWLRHRNAFRGAGNDQDLQWVFLPLLIETACTQKHRERTIESVKNAQREGHSEDRHYWDAIFNKMLRYASTATELTSAYMYAPSEEQRDTARDLLKCKVQADERALANKRGQCKHPGSHWRMYRGLIECALIQKDLELAKWGLALLRTHLDGEPIRRIEWENLHVRVEDLEQVLAA